MSLSIDEQIAQSITQRREEAIQKTQDRRAAGEKFEGVAKERKRIKSLGTMDASKQDISEYDFGKNYTAHDVNYLRRQGYDASQIADDFAKRGKKMGASVANYFLQEGQLGEDGNKKLRAMAKRRAGIYENKSGGDNNSVNNSGNTDNSMNNSGNTTNTNSFNTDNSVKDSYNTTNTDSFNTDNSFNAGDIDQNVGKRGDMNTTITDSTIGAGSSIGNDYSVTIGNVTAGNGANADSNTTSGLSNMQGLAAYQALNNNQFARSKSMLNGAGRAAQAIEQGQMATGSQGLYANLLNMVGLKQQYWQDRSTAQQGFYLGDIFGNRPSPIWQRPGDPKQPEDRTEEIANSFNPGKK